MYNTPEDIDALTTALRHIATRSIAPPVRSAHRTA